MKNPNVDLSLYLYRLSSEGKEDELSPLHKE
jgi:hypothetical protein